MWGNSWAKWEIKDRRTIRKSQEDRQDIVYEDYLFNSWYYSVKTLERPVYEAETPKKKDKYEKQRREKKNNEGIRSSV